MEKFESYCGWICVECCETYNLTEDRELIPGQEQFCENCGNLWTIYKKYGWEMEK
ncbi:MAG: hypothetical protein RR557_07120 [Bacilli bacterium]